MLNLEGKERNHMELQAKLKTIQVNLKVPKDLNNTFANFKYRNAEGILEKVKPFLDKEAIVLTLTDEMVEVGGRVYVKATAGLQYGAESLEVHGWAREQEEKKGMDQAQVTGAASSYARKYALAGLFLLDDGNDPDSHDNSDQGRSTGKIDTSDDRPATDKQKVYIGQLYSKKTGKNPKDAKDWFEIEYGYTAEKLTSEQASDLISELHDDN